MKTLILAALCYLFAIQANAVTINFEGEITSVQTPFRIPLSVGDRFTGEVVYDPATLNDYYDIFNPQYYLKINVGWNLDSIANGPPIFHVTHNGFEIGSEMANTLFVLVTWNGVTGELGMNDAKYFTYVTGIITSASAVPDSSYAGLMFLIGLVPLVRKK
jgi:hypothetical protein